MASARRQGLLAAEAEIALPGGALQLRWQGEGSHLWMTGPAAVAFRGEVDLSQLA
jgi:diaminopimelate epimerase